MARVSGEKKFTAQMLPLRTTRAKQMDSGFGRIVFSLKMVAEENVCIFLRNFLVINRPTKTLWFAFSSQKCHMNQQFCVTATPNYTQQIDYFFFSSSSSLLLHFCLSVVLYFFFLSFIHLIGMFTLWYIFILFFPWKKQRIRKKKTNKYVCNVLKQQRNI